MPTVSAWVSDEEKARFVKIAKDLGISESSIIKQAFTNAEIVDVKKMKSLEIDRLAKLSWIANNTGRIANYCDTKKVIDYLVLTALIEVQNVSKNL